MKQPALQGPLCTCECPSTFHVRIRRIQERWFRAPVVLEDRLGRCTRCACKAFVPKTAVNCAVRRAAVSHNIHTL